MTRPTQDVPSPATHPCEPAPGDGARAPGHADDTACPGVAALSVIVADCPWKFSDKLPGKSRGAARNYRCMPTAEIFRMPIPDVGPNAVLFLWCVESMQQEALNVAHVWGFTVKTSLIWVKLTATGKPHFGMGRTLRAAHERCIVATRGKCPPAVRNVRSVFSAPAGVHSQKPDEFYGLVERLYPDAVKYEMFARTVRPGWLQYGDELGKLGVAS